MTRHRKGYSPSRAHGSVVQQAIAPRVPEYRPEPVRAPYAGPTTPAEWVDAFAEMAGAQPDEYAELTGQRFTR